MAIVRELTKRHEEVIRGTVAACLEHVEQVPPLGECCLIIEGTGSDEEGRANSGEANQAKWWVSLTLAEHVAHYESQQINRKEAMKSAATDRGLSRRDVYQALLGASDE